MKYSLLFHPDLQDDILYIYHWYQKKDFGLGPVFLTLFYASVQKIQARPLAYMKINEEYRRCLMNRFPYAIYYYIENEEINITGLFHCAQDPRKIQQKLQDRK